MTATHLSAHRVEAGDTIDGIIARYQLSSRQALTEIRANDPLRPVFDGRENLREGMIVFVPPPAIRLARDRVYLMHAVRPLFISHFDELRDRADSDLVPKIREWRQTEERGDIVHLLASLGSLVDAAIESIARHTRPVIASCEGMLNTHVAEPTDHAVIGARGDPLCGLYWTVTPPILEQWRIMWDPDDCLAKWGGRSADDAVGIALRHLNAISSLVVQQVDQRIRDAQNLESRLRFES